MSSPQYPDDQQPTSPSDQQPASSDPFLKPDAGPAPGTGHEALPPIYGSTPHYGTQPEYGTQPGYRTPPGYGSTPGAQGDYAQPGYGQPGYGQPGYGGTPMYGAAPGYGVSHYGGYGAPAYPGYGDMGAPYGRDPYTGEPLSDKSKVVAGLLQIFLGSLGVGRFYIGDSKTGGIQLALTIVGLILAFLVVGIFILFGVAIWALVDGIMMLTGNVRDKNGFTLRP